MHLAVITILQHKPQDHSLVTPAHTEVVHIPEVAEEDIEVEVEVLTIQAEEAVLIQVAVDIARNKYTLLYYYSFPPFIKLIG